MASLILASTSRYRRELLERLRLPFKVARPEVDESPLPGERPETLAVRLAEAIGGTIRAGRKCASGGSDASRPIPGTRTKTSRSASRERWALSAVSVAF